MAVPIRASTITVCLAIMFLAGQRLAQSAQTPTVDSEIARATRGVDLTEKQNARIEELRREYSVKLAPLVKTIDELRPTLKMHYSDPFGEVPEIPENKAIHDMEAAAEKCDQLLAEERQKWDADRKTWTAKVEQGEAASRTFRDLGQQYRQESEAAHDRQTRLREQIAAAKAQGDVPEAMKKEYAAAERETPVREKAAAEALGKEAAANKELQSVYERFEAARQKVAAAEHKLGDEREKLAHDIDERKRSLAKAREEENKRLVEPRKKWNAAWSQHGALVGKLRAEIVGLLTPEQISSRIIFDLDSPTNAEFVETPLKDVLDYLQDLHQITIRYDEKALAAVGFDDMAITYNMSGITLHSILHLLLAEHGLVHLIDHGGLLITTVEEKPNSLKRGAIDPETLRFPHRDAAERRLADKLKQPVQLAIPEEPMYDFFSDLAKKAKLGIFVDEERFTRRETAIDLALDARGEPLDAVLRQALEPRGMAWSIRDESIVIVPKAVGNAAALPRRRSKNWVHPDELTAVTELRRIGADFTLNGRGRVDRLTANTSETLAVVPQLKDLNVLNVEFDPFKTERLSSDDFKHLAAAVQLSELQLKGGDVGIDDVKQLNALRHLNKLGLNGMKRTGAALAHLKGLKKIEELELQRSDIDDAGLSHLDGPPSLRMLVLWRTRITDAGLKGLRPLKLTMLWLDDTAITDAGLHELEAIDSLHYVSVEGTKVTRDGVEKFQKVRPHCDIRWDGNKRKADPKGEDPFG